MGLIRQAILAPARPRIMQASRPERDGKSNEFGQREPDQLIMRKPGGMSPRSG